MKENLFIYKVYSIVTVQILTSFAVSFVPYYANGVRDVLYLNPYVMSSAVIGLCANLTALYAYKNTYPANYVLLGLMSLFDAYLIGFVICAHSPDVVFKTLGFTTFSSGTIMAYAYVNRDYDFSWLRGGLLCCMGAFLVAVAAQYVFHLGTFVQTVIAFFGTCVFSLLLLYDAWLIRGYPHEEYVLAVIDLHLSIINIFMNALCFIKNCFKEDDINLIV